MKEGGGWEASGALAYPSMKNVVVTTSRRNIRPTFPAQHDARSDYRTIKTVFFSVCVCVFSCWTNKFWEG